MTAISDLALANAISFEAKKDSLRQMQNGDWRVSFTVQGVDMDERITRAAMGTRFVAVLVAINDDETPVQQPAKETQDVTRRLDTAKPSLAKPSEKAKREKMDWRDVQPAAQAGIRCDEAIFQAFLKENYPDVWRDCEQDAAAVVRSICCVHSRSEFSTDHRKRILWHQLDTEYVAWKALEHA